MAAKSSLTNMAVCLTAVCLVCSSILGAVYAVTYDPIQAAAQKALEESISAVLPQGGELAAEAVSSDVEGVDEYYVLSESGAPVAYAVKSTTMGFGGALTVMVGVLPDGTVYNTSVLAHSETPGLGAKCADAASHFREQFKNFSGSLKVTKDGGDIDAITASTITSRAFTKAVAQAVACVRALGVSASNTQEETNHE